MAKLETIVGKYIYLTVEGTEYRVYFEEAGEGIPLLCQHTAGSDGRQWRHLMNDEELTSKYRVLAADLPYHGKSLPPESVEWWKEEYKLTKSFFIDFLVEFSRALALDRPVYIGSSMGGHMALDLALERPSDFRAVIGVEAAEFTPGFYLDWWNHPRVTAQFKPTVMYELMGPTSPEKYKREIIYEYSQGSPPVFKGDLYYYCVDHNVVGKLEQIDTSRISVYLVTGTYDWASTPEMSRQAASKIKGAKFTELKGLGHFPMGENYAVCREFLMPILNEIAKG